MEASASTSNWPADQHAGGSDNLSIPRHIVVPPSPHRHLIIHMAHDYDLVVTNGIVVTASDTAAYDIAVKDGRISLLAPTGALRPESAQRVIDAEGAYVTVSPVLRPPKHS